MRFNAFFPCVYYDSYGKKLFSSQNDVSLFQNYLESTTQRTALVAPDSTKDFQSGAIEPPTSRTSTSEMKNKISFSLAKSHETKFRIRGPAQDFQKLPWEGFSEVASEEVVNTVKFTVKLTYKPYRKINIQPCSFGQTQKFSTQQVNCYAQQYSLGKFPGQCDARIVIYYCRQCCTHSTSQKNEGGKIRNGCT